MDKRDADRPDWLPSPEFVARWNAAEHRRGKPYATATDPMVMYAWHLVIEDRRRPFLFVSGC